MKGHYEDTNALHRIVIEQEFSYQKFLAGMGLTLLGLSIQFSPQYGKEGLPFLICAWVFFAAAISAATFRHINLLFLRNLDVCIGVLKGHPGEEESVRKNFEKSKKANKKAKHLFWAQLILMLVGLIFNGIFAVVNLLVPATGG